MKTLKWSLCLWYNVFHRYLRGILNAWLTSTHLYSLTCPGSVAGGTGGTGGAAGTGQGVGGGAGGSLGQYKWGTDNVRE